MVFSCNNKSEDSLEVWGDLNQNGKAEKYILNNGILQVYEDGKNIWISPEGYYIDSLFLGDVNNDGRDNLLLCLWKEGSFGGHRPFWHEGKDDEYKNHLFIYSLEKEKVKTVWCSSSLDRPIISFEVKDIDGDGLNELIVLEGKYQRGIGGKYEINDKASTEIKTWRWKQWGFSLIERD